MTWKNDEQSRGVGPTSNAISITRKFELVFGKSIPTTSYSQKSLPQRPFKSKIFKETTTAIAIKTHPTQSKISRTKRSGMSAQSSNETKSLENG